MGDFVDGAGWISDESSFYGDERTVRTLERKSRRKLELPHESPVKHAKLEKKSKRKLELSHQSPIKRAKLEKAIVPSHPDRPVKGQDDVLSFLKSRPQIGELQKTAVKGIKPSKKKDVTRTVAGEEAADFLDDDRFKGVRSAWQRNETVDAFLKRAPIMDPASAMLGGWLWVGNPKPERNQSKHEAKADIEAFVEGGELLLGTFLVERVKLEEANTGKAPATITRKLKPYKEQLEKDLLSLAVKTSTTCGKWMLFPSDDYYPQCWRVVAEATAEGKLGIISKAATPSPNDPINLICVYTYDFTDMNDVQRVLESLVELGLCQRDGKPIYYKCDGYTYLGIKSDNKFKLRASLYSSKDILVKEARPAENSPVARVKKSENQTLDTFFEF